MNIWFKTKICWKCIYWSLRNMAMSNVLFLFHFILFLNHLQGDFSMLFYVASEKLLWNEKQKAKWENKKIIGLLLCLIAFGIINLWKFSFSFSFLFFSFFFSSLKHAYLLLKNITLVRIRNFFFKNPQNKIYMSGSELFKIIFILNYEYE